MTIFRFYDTGFVTFKKNIFYGLVAISAIFSPCLTPQGLAQSNQTGSTFPAFPGSSNSKAAIKAAVSGKFPEAFRLAGNHALTRKTVEWFYLKAKARDAGFVRIYEFIRKNPHWPSPKTLRRKAEWTLMLENQPARIVLRYFKSYPPVSGNGKAALALAYLAEGNKKAAKTWIRRAWHYDSLGSKAETRVIKSGLRRFLSANDHKIRMDRMLYKRATASAGLRAAKRLNRDYVRLAEARIAVMKRSRHAARKIAAIRGPRSKNIGLLYNRIQWNRRHKNSAKAIRLLLGAPSNHKLLSNPIEWWTERRIGARKALAARKYRDAYRIAASHGFSSGYFFSDAEFLAGFIALRFLKRPKLALKHFTRLDQNANNPDRITRAQYWLGRTKQRLGAKAEAMNHFEKAAIYPTRYYGQLAINTLSRNTRISFSRPPRAKAAVQRTFMSLETVRAIKLLHDSGYDRLVNPFFYQLTSRLKTAGEFRLLAELADKLNLKHWVLRVGKIGLKRGFPTRFYAYPKGGMPALPRTKRVEKALVYGLVRQESEFNARARSHAGARGLMQIMPGTARHIAKQHGYRYSKAKLTSSPAYNAKLGTVHLDDLLKRFSGSYIMTIAAYNAGKGNIPKWNRAYGDPRTGKIDPIDWVELIPFTETRNYVQHVLENTQVYRARLNGSSSPIRLQADLHRGGGLTSLISRISGNK
jgi:soluble lytic murein transglycosylase